MLAHKLFGDNWIPYAEFKKSREVEEAIIEEEDFDKENAPGRLHLIVAQSSKPIRKSRTAFKECIHVLN
jgi:hypothetical protein